LASTRPKSSRSAASSACVWFKCRSNAIS
jgi:hypothetical protein